METAIINKIKIGSTDVFLEDMGSGSGKITISNSYGYNYSYYWGSMGESLNKFLLGLDEGYFVNKLIPGSDRGVFSGKHSVGNVRKHIKQEMKWDLPWYKFMDAQKDLRRVLKNIEYCETDRDFVDAMCRISKDVDCGDLDRWDEKEFKDALSSLECEPWHFIVNGPSEHTLFLKDLFPKLKRELKKI